MIDNKIKTRFMNAFYIKQPPFDKKKNGGSEINATAPD